MTSKNLEQSLYEKYKGLIPAVVSEFDGIVEKDVTRIAHDGLLKAIKAKLNELSPTFAAQSIRQEIQKFIQDTMPTEFVSLSDSIPGRTNALHPGEDTETTYEDVLADTRMPTPEDIYAITETLDNIDRFVNRFPSPTREIIKLRKFWPYQGMDAQPTWSKIAKELDLPIFEVKLKYDSAIRWVRDVIADVQSGPITNLKKSIPTIRSSNERRTETGSHKSSLQS